MAAAEVVVRLRLAQMAQALPEVTVAMGKLHLLH
jgi:hypothetical protein